MQYDRTIQHPKLLIIYASYGEGHLQAARAIRDVLESYGNHNTILCDLMAESHPWLNEVTRLFYRKSYSYLPHLYGWLYDITRPMKHNSVFGSWLHSVGRRKIKHILKIEQPDAVIHTFPLFALPELKRRNNHLIRSYAVITDFDLHCRWVHPSIERYYVATNDLKKQLQQLGLQDNQISVSGIPLKRGFQAAAATPELYARYQLNPELPIVMVMSGAQGIMSNLDDICEGLLKNSNVQIALICGYNQLLKSTIEQQFVFHPERSRLHIFGFVEPIHELMAMASCLVTKSGGITLAEAIASGLPIFIYRPVPGQEKQNALYLKSKDAAMIAYDPNELVQQIMKLMNDPLRLINSRASVKQLQEANNAHSSAESIVSDILTNIGIIERASIL